MSELTRLSKANSLKLIKKITFFDTLDSTERYFLSNLDWCFESYQKGELLTREGEKDGRIFVLISGRVNVIKGTPAAVITQLVPGEVFGEVNYLTGDPRTAGVVAASQCSALVLDQDMMAELPIEIREKLKDKIISILIKRLQLMNIKFSLLPAPDGVVD
ncbi:cyclic nucleotide-binding domain-containing protein [Neptuniibacter halophilus]|uniref:cyclic nucleotide-binding domain-containing protein n=1 Tax=Neptuniibacter halophilus TaxID=651666 RepID=UPI002573427B|nr:cyclic nucleotide-binding domain-containing protein [Neptuniibacter halophilus]